MLDRESEISEIVGDVLEIFKHRPPELCNVHLWEICVDGTFDDL